MAESFAPDSPPADRPWPWWEAERQGYFLQGSWDEYRAHRGIVASSGEQPWERFLWMDTAVAGMQRNTSRRPGLALAVAR